MSQYTCEVCLAVCKGKAHLLVSLTCVKLGSVPGCCYQQPTRIHKDIEDAQHMSVSQLEGLLVTHV